MQETTYSRNTTNPRYGPEDITHIVPWTEFNYEAIIQQCGLFLSATQIRPDPLSSSLAAIRDEPQFQFCFAELVPPRIRRALRAVLEQFGSSNRGPRELKKFLGNGTVQSPELPRIDRSTTKFSRRLIFTWNNTVPDTGLYSRTPNLLL